MGKILPPRRGALPPPKSVTPMTDAERVVDVVLWLIIVAAIAAGVVLRMKGVL
jgi:hypothetical protein